MMFKTVPMDGRGRRHHASLRASGAAGLLGAGLFLAACAGPATSPIADTGPIDLVGNCAQSDDDGFREQAHLDVRQGSVRALDWQILVGSKGSCRFGLDAFQQTRSRGHIELVSKDRSGCKLLVYQDPRRVTLAHAGCESRCTNGIHEQAWPVMFDPRSGGCANLNR